MLPYQDLIIMMQLARYQGTTTTFPIIVGCTLQKYENSPVFVNLCEYVLVGMISAVKPESNASPAFAVLGIPDVTVCRLLSLLFHVTVLPTLILIGFGENALLPRVAAPFTIKTLFVLVGEAEGEEGGCCCW